MSNTIKTLLVTSTVLAGLAAGAAHAQGVEPTPQGKIRVCTGDEKGNYHFGGGQIRDQAKGTLDVVLVPGTKAKPGSIDNLEKLQKGECDAAFTQADAFTVFGKQHPQLQLKFEVAESHLYSEVWHVICDTDLGLSKITGLKKPARIMVGPDGGGSATSWEALSLADPKRYGVLETSALPADRAMSQVAGNINNAACLFYVTGLKAPSMVEVNDYAQLHPKLALVNAADSDLLAIKDSQGKPVYTKFTIPDGTYKYLQPGTFSGAVDSVAVSAEMVVNTDYIDSHPDDYRNFGKFLTKATKAMRARVGQQ